MGMPCPRGLLGGAGQDRASTCFLGGRATGPLAALEEGPGAEGR